MTERRIVEYKMLRVSGNAMATEAVNKEIADGFQPYGSKIHIETGSDFFHFYIPMVRYAEPESTPDDEQDAEIERLRAFINTVADADFDDMAGDAITVGMVIQQKAKLMLSIPPNALNFERYIRGAAPADQTGGEG
jgi:hypothetical protein